MSGDSSIPSHVNPLLAWAIRDYEERLEELDALDSVDREAELTELRQHVLDAWSNCAHWEALEGSLREHFLRADELEQALLEYQVLADEGDESALSRVLELHPAVADGLRETLGLARGVERLWHAPPVPSTLDGGPAIAGLGTPGTLAPGARIGDCVIVGHLCNGGFGEVYRARQENTRREVALKVLNPRASQNLDRQERFQREIVATAELKHPNIIRIFHGGRHAGQLYYVMELLSPATLADRVASYRDARSAASLVEQIARAVGAAHAKGWVHRDLKPANILFDEHDRPQVTDFGLARRLDRATEPAPAAPASALEEGEAESNEPLATRADQVIGTPGYQSPEQRRGAADVGPTSDVFCLGIILFELLAGRRPFAQESRQAPLDFESHFLRGRPLPFASEIVDPDLRAILSRALAYSPDTRYADGTDLADDLRRLLAQEPLAPTTRRTPPWDRARKWIARHPLATGCYVLLVALLAIVAAFTVRLDGANRDNLALREAAELDRGRAERARDDALRSQGIAEAATREANKQRLAAQESERVRAETFELHLNRELERHFDTALRALLEKRHKVASDELAAVPIERRSFAYYWLRDRIADFSQPYRILSRHDWGLSAQLLDRSAKWLVTAGLDGVVRVSAVDGSGVRELRAAPPVAWLDGTRVTRYGAPENSEPAKRSSDPVLDLAWIKEGEEFVSASAQGLGEVWQLAGGEPRLLFAHPEGLALQAVAHSAGRVLFGDSAGTLFLVPAWGETRRLSLGGGGVIGIAALPGGHWLVGQEDGRLSLLGEDLRTQLAEAEVAAPLLDFAVAADGAWLVAAGKTLVALRLDESAGTLGRRKELFDAPWPAGSPQRFDAVALDPSRGLVAAADESGHLGVWRLGDSQALFLSTLSYTPMLNDETRSRFPSPLARRVTGLAFLSAGGLLVESGANSITRAWSRIAAPGLPTQRVGASPRIVFDRVRPDWVWVGDASGGLELRDTRTGAQLAAIAAHDAVSDIAGAANGVVVTAGRDGWLKRWRHEVVGGGRAIVPVGRPLRHERSLRSVGIHPDGELLAAYDSADQALLWRATEESPVVVVAADDSKPAAVSGAVAFSADGTQLAVCGQGQQLHIIDVLATPPVALIAPPLVAGQGGTALDWHPRESLVTVGDTLGRVQLGGKQGRHGFGKGSRDGASIAAISYSPDGRTIAAIDVDGHVVLLSPDWHWSCVLPDRHELACDIAFDPRGEQLLVATNDGALIRLDGRTFEPRTADRPWDSQVLLDGEQAEYIDLGHMSAAFDSRGALRMLLGRRRAGTDRTIEVVLGTWRDGRLQTQVLDTLAGNEPTERSLVSLRRSLTIVHRGDEVWGGYRAPRPEVEEGYSGELRFVRLPADGSPVEPVELPREAMNCWFDPIVGQSLTGEPVITHFSHAGERIWYSVPAGDRWRTWIVGGAGDGFALRGAIDGERRQHLLFNSRRFPGDTAAVTYMVLEPHDMAGQGEPRVALREVVDSTASGALSLRLSQNGEPWILYMRRAEQGGYQLVVAQRTERGWAPRVVGEDRAPLGGELTLDRDGQPWVVAGFPSARVYSYTWRPDADDWRTELLWRPESMADLYGAGAQFAFPRLSPDGEPLVLFVTHHSERGWLRLLRPWKTERGAGHE